MRIGQGDTDMTNQRNAEQIEREVEMRMNAADNALMNRTMTQIQYDTHVKAINRWADRLFAKVA